MFSILLFLMSGIGIGYLLRGRRVVGLAGRSIRFVVLALVFGLVVALKTTSMITKAVSKIRAAAEDQNVVFHSLPSQKACISRS